MTQASTSTQGSHPLSTSTIWTWASVGLPLAMIGYPVGIYLPDLYSGERGLSLSIIGTMLMLARVSDAITDPLMGFASDRIHTRFGRRKPWIAIGVPTMLLGMWMLFTPGEGVGPGHLLLWFAFMTLGSTLIALPHRAWGAELSTDYRTRTRIASANETFVVIGLIVAAAVPFGVKHLYPEGVNSGALLRAIAIALLFVLPVVAALVLWRVPEPSVEIETKPFLLRRSLTLISKNGVFRLLLLMEFLITGGEYFRNALSLFFMRDVVGIELGLIATMYVLYFCVGLLAIPIWTRLANRFGKHRSLGVAMLTVSIVSVWIFMLDRGDFVQFYVLFAAKGFCFGAFAYLPRAMIADVVDVDTAKTGSARPGSYFAVHGIVTKVAAAAGTGLSLIIAGWVGYEATRGGDAAGLVNGPTELLWLGVLYAIVPTVMFLFAFYFAWTYPLTQARHQRLELALRKRANRLARNR